MTDEPVKDEKPLPPSPNPDLPRQLQLAASSGDPSQALDALVAAGVVSKETRDNMVAVEAKQKEGLQILAHQISNNTEGIRVMAHAMDLFRDGVRGDLLKCLRELELIRRALEIQEAYEEAKARRDERDAAEKAKAEKERAKSSTSTKVTTSPPTGKLVQTVK